MGKRKRLTGAEILVEVLMEQGITDVFGYPGSAVLDIYDVLYQKRRRIRHVLTAHEQGAAHAADGYSRVTGKVGVVIATSGPGATNLVTGIATAMLDSIPMVAITGNVATHQIGKDSFQEINITGVTLPITKHNYFVSDVTELADTIREAFRIAKSGRPGPVLIDIPRDVQTAKTHFEPEGIAEPFPQDAPQEADIERAAALIAEAKRPYLYIGGGAAGAGLSADIMAMADKIDAYIGCSFMGLTALPSSFERFLGMQGMHGRYASSAACREADLIIGLGVRFSDRATGNTEKYKKGATIIQIDADLAEIGKNVPVELGIVGDISAAFRQILAKCQPAKHPEWGELVRKFKEEGRHIREASDTAPAGVLTPPRIFDMLNTLKADDTVIVTDVGQHQMWTAQYVRFERTRRFASSGGLGTMGYGLGAAIGAAIAGNRAVLITGDGSFGMNLTELATAVSCRLPITIILLNNGVLGMVRQWQTLFYKQHYSATVLERQTDYVKLAEAFGAKACRAADPNGLESALRRAMTHPGPTLIEVPIDPDEFVLPMLPPGGSLDEII
ncbi:MAG: biosynthetic-type acetolactate synthase large subunit, partial [Ruminococcaceae bacterium]|nr:biosynthetic-type acetolactate synthase large subunit [Oscillospiraceae bacterium]